LLTNGWGRLANDQVRVYLPRDQKELEIVWRVIRQAYDRFTSPQIPESGSVVVSTWDSYDDGGTYEYYEDLNSHYQDL
jgi:hypothetical protein